MHPRAGQTHQQLQPVGFAAANFAMCKLQLMDGGFDSFPLKTGGSRLFQSFQYQFFQISSLPGIGALQTGGEKSFAIFVVVAGTGADPFAQPGIDQRLAQRSGSVSQKQLGKQGQAQSLKLILNRIGQPAHEQKRAPLQGLARLQRKGAFYIPGTGKTLLQRNGALNRLGAKMAQYPLIDQLQRLFQREAAIGIEPGVAGMVVGVMKPPQFLPGKIEDSVGLSAGIPAIGGRRVQCLGEAVVGQRGRIGKRALHFVVDHALGKQRIRTIQFKANPFLVEIGEPQKREEGRVEIHLHQVMEILAVLGGKGIEGPVAGGQGVHERVEAAVQHGKENVPHRIAPGTAQRRMFEDMRHAAGVEGRGAKSDAENIFLIVVGQMHKTRAGRFVPQLVHRQAKIIQFGYALGNKSGMFCGHGHQSFPSEKETSALLAVYGGTGFFRAAEISPVC